MTSTDSRARSSRARAVRRPRVARGDAPASAEVARRRCSRRGGTDARGRDDRLGTIERADPDADPRGEPDATLHRGKRPRRMVLTLRALRRVVDAGALCGMVRLQGRRRDPDLTGMGERGGRVGRELHAEQRARAGAPPRSGGQHSSGQRHHCSAAEAGRRRSIRRLCRIQSSPWGVSIILMVFSYARLSQNAAGGTLAGHVLPRGVQIRAVSRQDRTGAGYVTTAGAMTRRGRRGARRAGQTARRRPSARATRSTRAPG